MPVINFGHGRNIESPITQLEVSKVAKSWVKVAVN